MFNRLKDVCWLAMTMGVWLLGMRFAGADTNYVRFSTNLGNIDVQLYPGVAPATVTNFLSYVNSTSPTGNYTNSVFHRISNLTTDGVVVIQGGAFYRSTSLPLPAITTSAAVVNERNLSNIRGTLAMAKLGGNPNSATSQWFFNTVDNTDLDPVAQDGGFTVFGAVMNTPSLAVMDAIAAVPVFSDGGADNGGALTEIPLINYVANTPLQLSNFVTVTSIAPLTVVEFSTWQTTFFAGQSTAVSDPAATPQNDGATNLLKYVCDVTPMRSMPATDRAKLPVVGSTTVSGAKVMTLTYHQRPNLVGVFLNVVTSTDLVAWTAPTNATTTLTTATDGSNDTIVQVQVPAPTTGSMFIRLVGTQATTPPSAQN